MFVVYNAVDDEFLSKFNKKEPLESLFDYKYEFLADIRETTEDIAVFSTAEDAQKVCDILTEACLDDMMEGAAKPTKPAKMSDEAFRDSLKEDVSFIVREIVEKKVWGLTDDEDEYEDEDDYEDEDEL